MTTVLGTTLAVAVLCAAPVFAQSGDETAVDKTGGGVTMDEAAGAVAPQPPVEAKSVVRSGLSRYMSPVVSFRPRRIAPGQGGDTHIVLALVDPAVLPAGAHFVLTYEKEQGPVSLGEYVLQPAKPGALPTAFKGQLVYDNTAAVIVPITVAAEAEHGQLDVKFALEAEITDGGNGTPLGRYAMDFSGRLEVGKPLPTPIPRDPADTVGESVAAAPVTAPDRGAAAAADSTARARGVQAAELHGDGNEPGVEPGAAPNADTLIDEGDSTGSWLPYAVPLALIALIALIALLFMRRRS